MNNGARRRPQALRLTSLSSVSSRKLKSVIQGCARRSPAICAQKALPIICDSSAAMPAAKRGENQMMKCVKIRKSTAGASGEGLPIEISWPTSFRLRPMNGRENFEMKSSAPIGMSIERRGEVAAASTGLETPARPAAAAALLHVTISRRAQSAVS